MGAIVLLVVVLAVSTNCSNQKSAVNNAQATGSTARPAAVAAIPENVPEQLGAPNEEPKNVPSEFRSVDFKNFSYPTNIRGNITLKDGERIFYNPEGGGDIVNFVEVGYSDLNGDGKEEAIAHLSVASCGASCDGGSHLFYFYSSGRNKPQLLSRLETGSAGYGECGLKAFELNKSNLALELFQICQKKGISFRSLADPKNKGGKFEAQSYTRFRYVFKGDRFVARHREVFPFPQGDVRTYERTVIFNN